MISPHQVSRRETGLAEQVFRRMARFAQDAPMGVDPHGQVRALRQAYEAGGDTVFLIAFLNAEGHLVGHAAATLDGQDCLLVHQAVLDGPAGDALARGILLADTWAQARGARFMLMAATDHPDVWTRRYGFEFSRYLMGRPLGAPIPALGGTRAPA